MSYILDALKKIEEKREREEPPKGLTFSKETLPERKKRALWPYFLLLALLLNAGIMIWWVVPRHEVKKESPTPLPANLQQSLPTAPPESKKEEPKQTPVIKEVLPTKDVTVPLARTVEKETKKEPLLPPVKPPVPDRASSGKPSVPDRVAAEQPVPRLEKGVPTPGKVYTLSELPAAVKASLPEFKVSGHAYSTEQQNRVTRINDRILQEGQDLSPGLKVEEIVPEGIILSYEGYRFRIGVKEIR
jgi:general secretion pathway protein B